jgi:tRNA 2-thiouridine synthesizing protein E
MTATDAMATTILQRLGAIDAHLRELVERQRKTEELFTELTPIARLMLASATTRLGELERKGYFAFAEEAGYVAQRIVESYEPKDVRAFGDAIVSILDTVRTMTQPEVLSVIEEATAVVAHADRAEPIGLVGMVRATRQEEVQKGMAVMMELLRKLGKGASVLTQQPAAPRTRRRALGVERAAPRTSSATTAGPACAVPGKPPVTATVLDGVAFTAEGHLVDSSQWTEGLARTLAEAQRVALSEVHWKVLAAARKDFLDTGVAPNIRRLTQVCAVTTKDLYTLFPRAPGRTIAKIAGLPKPAGCL